MSIINARKFVFECYGLPHTEGPLPLGLPSSLNKENLDDIWGVRKHHVQYVVSFKSDGHRRVMGWTKTLAFNMGREGDAACKIPWKVHALAYDGTLLDCEFMDKMIIIHDAISVNGHNIRTKPYHYRLQLANTWLKMTTSRTSELPSGFSTIIKDVKIHHFDDYCIFVKPIWDHMKPQECFDWGAKYFPVDGLVYTPLTREVPKYRSLEMFKWKPKDRITIDFLVRSVPGNTKLMQLLVVNEDNKLTHFQTVPFRCKANLRIHSDQIYETKWIPEAKQWQLELHRDQRKLPNALLTVQRTIQNITEDIQLVDLVP